MTAILIIQPIVFLAVLGVLFVVLRHAGQIVERLATDANADGPAACRDGRA
jgi:hypothetical protein